MNEILAKGNSHKKINLAKEEVFDLDKPKTSKGFEYNEVLKKSLKYFNGDELAATVWIKKYALKDSNGKIYESSPDDMHRRMASEIARIEQKYPNPISEEKIYELLKQFKYLIPQGGSMSGIGNQFQVSSLSNCFVIGNKADSYGGIMRTDEEQIQLMKRRGGVGHDLSYIRPKNSLVNNTARTSTGIVPFMERFSNSTREVAQDGRRGALMLSLSIKHPNSEEFIDAKLDTTKITGANISLKIDDNFMKAVINEEMYSCSFPIDSESPTIEKKVDAIALWNKVVHNAWKSAEPGILFWDTIIKESIPDCYKQYGFETVSTNPCGEIPLCQYDSCRLLAINLFSYVKRPFNPKAEFDFNLFKKHASMALRIMDDIIDLEIEKIDTILRKIEKDPEPLNIKLIEFNLWKKIREKCSEGRRAGIGITAEGDMLASLNFRYGSDEAISFACQVHKTLALSVYRSSVNIAKERGSFELYDSELEKKNPFILRIKASDPDLYSSMCQYGRRNIALLTIAPTGTTSIMTQTSSGIEPAFKINYTRRKKINPLEDNSNSKFADKNGDHWEEYNVFHHKFYKWLNIQGIDEKMSAKLSNADLAKLITQSPYHNSTANDIDWLQKVKMQGAIQKWVDHSISVTVNLPNDVSHDIVNQLMIEAWKTGCKGITIYRNGSRDGVLLSNEKESGSKIGYSELSRPIKRPKRLKARVIRFNNFQEKWIAVVGLVDDKPYEIFTGKAEENFIVPNFVKDGYVIKIKTENGNRYDFQYKNEDGSKIIIEGLSRSFNKIYWNYAKLISGILRHGMPLPYVVELVSGLNSEDTHIHSWANGVARAIKIFIPNGTNDNKKKCDSCGENGSLVYSEGCLICKNCGFSKCS